MTGLMYFTFKIIYESIERTTTFSLTENFSIKDDTIMKIDNDNNMLYTVIEKGVTFTYESLIKNINSENNQIIVKNNNNEVVTSGTVGTGYTITTNSNTYSIVISGDATGDGKINSGDLVKIVKHLKGTTTTNEAQRIASDCNNDNKVNSGDLVRLVKFLKGTSSITIRG